MANDGLGIVDLVEAELVECALPAAPPLTPSTPPPSPVTTARTATIEQTGADPPPS